MKGPYALQTKGPSSYHRSGGVTSRQPNVVGAAVGSEATHRPSRAWPPLPRSAREQEGHLHPPLLHDLQTTAMDVFPCVRDCVSPSHLLPK